MTKITELTVAGLWSATKDNGVDLDGRRLLSRPAGIDEWTEEQRRRWLKDNGYDLSVDLNDQGVWLHAVETNLMVIPNPKWEETDLSWIPDTLQPGSLASPLVFWELPPATLPLTFAFRTAGGASGLFRVTAYSQVDKKATIQIKLHQ